MNIISALFTNPEAGGDQQVVDLLEQDYPDLVEVIRNAETEQEAKKRVRELWAALEKSDREYAEEVEFWLCRVNEVSGAEEKAGFHQLQSEANAGVKL